MGKKEKNERKVDKNTTISPAERTFREGGKPVKYELTSDTYDHDYDGRQEAERVGKGTEKLFPDEKTRVAPVDIKTRGYGLYFRKSEEPKERKPRTERRKERDPKPREEESKERHFKSEASERRFKEGAHKRIKEEACERKRGNE